MDINDFIQIGKFAQNNEDVTDLYLYKIVPLTFFISSTLTLAKDIFFDPIVCWVPKEWSIAYDEYTRAACWIEGTYFLKSRYNVSTHLYDTTDRTQNYYQWVSIFLIGLSLFMKIPQFLWETYSNHNISYLASISQINSHLKSLNPTLQNLALDVVVQMFKEISHSETKFNDPIATKLKKAFDNNKLLIFYILIKFICLIFIIIAIYLITKFIRVNSITFGFELVRNVYLGSKWQNTGIFPVITWCKVAIKEDGDEYSRNVQCVLPHNVFNEKIFVGILFLLLIGLILLTINIMYWSFILFASSNHARFIHKHLYFIFKVRNGISRKKTKTFINTFLKRNGVFLIYFLYDHVDEEALQKILKCLWDNWQSIEKEKEEKTLL